VLIAGGSVNSSTYLSAAHVYVLHPQPLPAVAAVTPPTDGVGKSVTISGSGLSGATAVWIAGVPAKFSVVSDTHLTAKVPRGALVGPTAVLTPFGLAWCPADFIVKPNVKIISPTSGPPGTVITITGSAFTGTTKVKLGNKSLAFTVHSYSSITATVPTGAATNRIKITTPNGTSKSKGAFTVT
jgi:IPT/TIG domain